jgi:glutaredoxin 3
MATKRKIEVFSASCAVCEDTIVLINRIACPSCEVEILDMHKPDVAKKAKRYGIQSVPAIVVDGRLADCCTGRGPDEAMLRATGIGQA